MPKKSYIGTSRSLFKFHPMSGQIEGDCGSCNASDRGKLRGKLPSTKPRRPCMDRLQITIADIAEFVEAKARIANHPVFGNIHANDDKNDAVGTGSRRRHRAQRFCFHDTRNYTGRYY